LVSVWGSFVRLGNFVLVLRGRGGGVGEAREIVGGGGDREGF
jgi:hypothetical protein